MFFFFFFDCLGISMFLMFLCPPGVANWRCEKNVDNGYFEKM